MDIFTSYIVLYSFQENGIKRSILSGTKQLIFKTGQNSRLTKRDKTTDIPKGKTADSEKRVIKYYLVRNHR